MQERLKAVINSFRSAKGKGGTTVVKFGPALQSSATFEDFFSAFRKDNTAIARVQIHFTEEVLRTIWEARESIPTTLQSASHIIGYLTSIGALTIITNNQPEELNYDRTQSNLHPTIANIPIQTRCNQAL